MKTILQAAFVPLLSHRAVLRQQAICGILPHIMRGLRFWRQYVRKRNEICDSGRKRNKDI